MSFPRNRPRRMRRTAALRSLVRETDLAPHHLIAPLFVKEGVREPVPISSMPGQFQHALESVCADEEALRNEVRVTVIHELAHHFGISDRRLRELGWA